MAVGTVSVIKQGVLGNMKYALVNVVGAASYTTTGDALNLEAVTGFSNIYFVDSAPFKTASPTTNQSSWAYDKVNKKLQGFGTAAGATGLTEVGSGVDVSATTITLFILGS